MTIYNHDPDKILLIGYGSSNIICYNQNTDSISKTNMSLQVKDCFKIFHNPFVDENNNFHLIGDNHFHSINFEK